MCGIFGIILGEGSEINISLLKKTLYRLYSLSESRGKEASGIVLRANNSIYVLKEPVTASRLIKSEEYNGLLDSLIIKEGYTETNLSIPFAVFGHSRLVTNGSGELNTNNQPVMKDGLVGIHNGIIVNDAELWKSFPSIKKKFDVDTEVLLSLLQMYRKAQGSLAHAVRSTFSAIYGSASVAIQFDDINVVLLASNTGSLYTCYSNNGKILLFASEKYILKELIKSERLDEFFDEKSITQVAAGTGYIVNLLNLKKTLINLYDATSDNTSESDLQELKLKDHLVIKDLSKYSNFVARDVSKYRLRDDVKNEMIRTWERLYSGELDIKRCTRCLNTEYMPFITFDEDGICNYCRSYDMRIQKGDKLVKGEKALEEIVSKYRSKNGEQDCIVGFSGGRDSSYGLDYIINNLKMHPITFTYDWGMVVDLARRNQARVTGKLGVEQILVSADIKRKRENIKMNFEAWLKRPNLGMIPILMAGDKKFYYYFHKVREQNNIPLFIFCGGHEYEETRFKYGFCGIKHGIDNTHNRVTGISWINKIKLLSFYAINFLLNPAYINRSIIDTFDAFYSTYVLHDDYLYLYHYLKWDEKVILDHIIQKFDWERSPDTKATWRIDDGTAAIYNYMYMAIAGFSEFDDFRSFQIRDGSITREEAYNIVKEENKPRFSEIEWYAEVVDLDINKAIETINKAPKLYQKNTREMEHKKVASKSMN